MNPVRMLYLFPTFLPLFVRLICLSKKLQEHVDSCLDRVLEDELLEDKYKCHQTRHMLSIGRKGKRWEYFMRKRHRKVKSVSDYSTKDLFKTEKYIVQKLILR